MPALIGAGQVIIGAAPGKMHHGIDRTGPQRCDQGRRERHGDHAVDDSHLGGDAVRRQFTGKIGSSILAGKIEQGGVRVGTPRDQHPHQITHIAVRRANVHEAA